MDLPLLAGKVEAEAEVEVEAERASLMRWPG